MQNKTLRWRSVARHVSEAVPAILLAVMFLSFIIQVVMRYALDQPVAWTVEVCVIAWLWVILWGQSVSVNEDDEIRFDIVYGTVSPKVRRIFRIVFSAFLVVIYTISMPAVWNYVTFMKIEETSYFDIPYSWVFSIFVIFTLVSILRYAWIFWTALKGRETVRSYNDASAVTRKDCSE